MFINLKTQFFEQKQVKGFFTYKTGSNANYPLNFQKTYSFEETSPAFKFLKNNNPLFKFDFKVGNYFSKDDLLKNPTLLSTFSEMTGGVRKNL